MKLVNLRKEFYSFIVTPSFNFFKELGVLGTTFDPTDKISDASLRKSIRAAKIEHVIALNHYIWNPSKGSGGKQTGRIQLYFSSKEAALHVVNSNQEIRLGHITATFYVLYNNVWDSGRDYILSGLEDVSKFVVKRWVCGGNMWISMCVRA